MDVLAYLLAPEGKPHGIARILTGDSRTDEDDEQHLQRFSKILLGLEPGETFNALCRSRPFQWYDNHGYDIVNPFGDRRQIHYHSLWTFDTPKDMLYHTNRHNRSQMSLSLLRDRIVSMADMEILGGAVPVPLSLEQQFGSEKSYWRPIVKVDDRERAYTHRLLRDFHHQWRHILRNHYNFTTLQVMARAIIRLSTLDFEIHEDTGGSGARGVHVWIMHSPSWDPLKTDVVRVGDVNFVLCQEIQDGLSRAKQHLSSQQLSAIQSLKAVDPDASRASYVILSVKHIMLCHVTGLASLAHTAPEPLFNGDYGSGSPSELALDYLIWTTASARPLITTQIQILPIEVQDMILKYVSHGTVEAARLGCLLGLGTPFLWRDGSLTVTLEDRHTIRPTGYLVESQIWFGQHKSGIVYVGRKSRK